MCRIVKSSTGLTVVEFLHRMRIEEAKRLLRESKDCIYLIADQVGFKSPCYFSTVFKELEGRSPKEYRRLHLLGDGGEKEGAGAFEITVRQEYDNG